MLYPYPKGTLYTKNYVPSIANHDIDHNLKLSLMASPNLLIASVMFSAVAAANVARKKSSFGSVSCSARNQDPRATKTPLAMQELKISSSTSKMPFPAWIPGCWEWSILSQYYRTSC